MRMTFRAALIALMLMPIGAQAQEFRIIGEGRFAEITGKIEIGAGERFSDFLEANPEVIGVRLNSPGGVVVSALDIADQIFDRRLSTFIANDEVCASACSLLFFAGHDRLARGRLGVHQMDDGGRADASTLQFALAEQIDAFQRFEVPWSILRQMLTTSPRNMYWITEYELNEFALNRDLPGDASSYLDERKTVGQTSPRLNFADYLTKTYNGDLNYPDFSGRDSGYRYYRTRISQGAEEGINFAGKYSIIEVGCGTSCRFAFMVDLETGEVSGVPYGGEENYQMKLLYSPDSRLLRVRWLGGYGGENWDNNTCTEHDVVYNGSEWEVLLERTVPQINGFCDY